MKSNISKIAVATMIAGAMVFGSAATAANAETVTTTALAPVTATISDADAAALAAYRVAKAEFKAAMVVYRAAKASYKAQRAAYKAVMIELKPTLKAYRDARKVIGQTFSTAVKLAKANYQAAILGVTDPELLLAAKNDFDAAKATASANRAAAIAALGPAPVKPAAPVKPTKPVKPTRQ